MRKFILFLSCGLVLLIIGEVTLRFFWGFCSAPLYIPSREFEYIPKPDQEGRRFGNNYYYNSFSQRNAEPDSTKIIILGLGDSVIHGGVQSDQDSIATSIFSREVQSHQMLNISAGSWGPDNCAAYIKENGSFDAKAIFLVVSSHDAFDNMDFKPVIDIYPAYPSRQYFFAWGEVIDRYLIPKIKSFFNKKRNLDPDQKINSGVGIKKGGNVFNHGFNELKLISDSLHIPLFVYLHADKQELKKRAYNSQGLEIIRWANENNVFLIKELDYNFSSSDYRDGIHINNQGQRKLAGIMKKFLLTP